MAEYAGYVQRAAPIDWGMVAEDIITKLGDVEKDKAAFREKYDTIANDLYKELGDYEAGKSQSFNEFVYNGIASGRTTLAALHEKLKRREISPDDFNRATMSMSSQMDDFKKLTTHYNEAIANTQKGIDDGKLSGLSVFASERLASIADFKNKNLQWMPNQNGYTNLYINPVDENGNITGEPISVTSLVTPGNLEYKRTDVVEEAKKFTSQLGEFQKGRIYDATAREKYKKARTDIVNSIVNDANSVASILSEYGGYTFYEEGQPKPEGKSLMVKVDDNHMLVPDVNAKNHDDPAVKEAREIVENIINQQVDYRETPAPSSKDKGNGDDKRIQKLLTGYNIVKAASLGDFNGMNKTNFKFKKTENGIEIWKKTETKTIPIHVGDDALKPGTLDTQRILSQYTKQFSSSGSQGEWDEIHAYLGENKGKDVDVKITAEEVEGEAFTPSDEDITVQNLLWSGGTEAGHEGVDNANTPEKINAVKPTIIQYIQKNAPNAEVTFGNITEFGTGLTEDYYAELPLKINGVDIDVITFDKRGGSQDAFDAIIKKAIDVGRKEKKAIYTTTGEVGQQEIDENL